ncbi:MAG: SAF domain-containing protein [Bifidobacteriaceae bacterium]|jgi:hypothetical protein|nr:SAF domain-containing protein [Bifidobacteriaceae bacterium]MCI1979580.1 SAF domain-containing protein [Bifidobacteriaceae bacterium]
MLHHMGAAVPKDLQTRRKMKRIIDLGLVLLCAFATTLVVSLALPSADAPVLVARKHIEAGHTINADDVRVQLIDAHAVASNAATAPQQAIGQVSVIPIPSGGGIPKQALSYVPELPANSTVITVTVAGNTRNLSVGDSIAVLSAGLPSSHESGTTSTAHPSRRYHAIVMPSDTPTPSVSSESNALGENDASLTIGIDAKEAVEVLSLSAQSPLLAVTEPD